MLRRLRLTVTSALQSLIHYRRSYAATAAGALLASLLFTGSLLTGASVHRSLEISAVQKLGAVEYALELADGYFPASLAVRLGARLKTPVVPALSFRGEASVAGAAGDYFRRVRVVGVPDSFFGLFSTGTSPISLPSVERIVLPNAAAARGLGCREGDDLVLRVEKLSLLPLEAAAGRGEERFFSIRLKTGAVLQAAAGGGFALTDGPTAPLNLFVSWETLARAAGLRGQANLLLAKERGAGRLTRADLQLALAREMKPADYGLRLSGGFATAVVEAQDDRLFMSEAAEAALRDIDPAARGRLVYFVNRLGNAPYSFAAAVDPADLPVALRPGEMIVSDWLAADQGLAPGSALTVSYYTIAEGATLAEKEARFTVRAVLSQTHPLFDARRTPAFPGLTDAAACRDWRSGLPLDFSRIRPKDEAFWNAFRASPKAIIGLPEGQVLWGNRFGRVTSLALRGKKASADPKSEVESGLAQRLVPARFGFSFTAVREEAANAVAAGVDFTGLFAGLSFFAVAAGLVLAAFLFSSAVTLRHKELGLLRAVGFSRGRVLARLGLEGTTAALAGSAAGAVLGLAFTGAMIALLQTLFRGAIGGAELGFHVSAPHFIAGLAASFVFALAVFAAVLLKKTGAPVVTLLSGVPVGKKQRRPRRLLRLFAAAIALGAGFFLTLRFQARGIDPWFFFLSAMLFFAGLLLALDAALIFDPRARVSFPATPLARARAALRANRGRTVTSVFVLALGVFLVTAVGANTSSLPVDPGRRDTGTGGFALFMETTVPIPENLNDTAARTRLGLADLPDAVSFVSLRVRQGDEASCLNLNRALDPEVVGVPVAALLQRKAFAFSGTAVRFASGTSGWNAIDFRPGTLAPTGAVPAAADEASLEWSLGIGLGDELAIHDEAGRERRLRINAAISNSLFQGSVLVSEDEFLALFPSSGGYTRFLVDAPGFSRAAREKLAADLQNGLRAYGADVTTAEARLFRFNEVANTYLLMFLILGGLGLLIGIGGFGVFIRQSLAERLGEIALLRAIGIPGRLVFHQLLAEQCLVLAGALGLGLLASFSALLPIALKAADRLPWAAVAGLVIVMAGAGFLLVRSEVRRALRTDIMSALKNE